MAHEQKAGMIKIPLKNYSQDDIGQIAKIANCSTIELKSVLDIVESEFSKKEYIDIAELMNRSGLEHDKLVFISQAMEKYRFA